MIQSGSGAVSAALGGNNSNARSGYDDIAEEEGQASSGRSGSGPGSGSQRSSLSLVRTHTKDREDRSGSKRSSIGLPSWKERDTDPGGKRSSIGFPRSRTREDSAGKRSSIGLPRSQTRDGDSGSSKRASLKSAARAMNPFAKGSGSDQNSATESTAFDGPLRHTGEASDRRAPALPPKDLAEEEWTKPTLSWPPPLSTSPEMSKVLQDRLGQVVRDGLPSSTDRPMDFLDPFVRHQSFAVLIEGKTGPGPFAGSSGIAAIEPAASTVGGSSILTISSSAASMKSTNTVGAASGAAHHLGTAEATAAAQGRLIHREMVNFYARAGRGKDVPLGQLVEEMALRATALASEIESCKGTGTGAGKDEAKEKGANANAKTAAAAKENLQASLNEAPQMAIHYIHSLHKVTVTAVALPCLSDHSNKGEGAEDTTSIGPESSLSGPANAQASSGTDLLGSSSSSTSGADETDIAAVAAALHTDRASAKAAVAVAETAVHAVEGSDEESGISQDTLVWMWNADVRTGEQSVARPMSEVSFMFAFRRKQAEEEGPFVCASSDSC